MQVHAFITQFNIMIRVLFSEHICFFITECMRNITNQRIVRTGLISKRIRNNLPLNEPVQQVNRIAYNPDTFCFILLAGDHLHCEQANEP